MYIHKFTLITDLSFETFLHITIYTNYIKSATVLSHLIITIIVNDLLKARIVF